MRLRWKILAGVMVFLSILAALVWWLNLRGEDPIGREPVAQVSPRFIENGRKLALVGNCAGCHTERGGAQYAGGRAIETPFGNVYASNITPDRSTGIGDWSASEFWRAMHNGRSKDGRLLYPAFPYQHFTLVTREDTDAIYAYLRTLPAVERANKAHELRFPYNLQASLAVWRALYFRPARFEPAPKRSATWNRGAYLVRGLGHCSACHAGRNFLGAPLNEIELGGGLIPMQDWYAPSLADPQEAGMQDWSETQIAALMKSGVSEHGSVLGPMAEVVYRSTQHLPDEEIAAIATYLKQLPRKPSEPPEFNRANTGAMQLGAKIYADRCAACHGEKGEGFEAMYPPLAGNRAVTLAPANNVVKAILYGGFPPTTTGNPRPFGMPGFAHALKDAEIAVVSTYIRQAWGNSAPPVSAVNVGRNR